MTKNIGVQKGVFSEIKKNKKELIPFLPIFKDLLTYLHIPLVDDCCDDGGNAPSGYNIEDDTLRYYDKVTNSWIIITLGNSIDPETYPVYIDNPAAIAGGLQPGEYYKTPLIDDRAYICIVKEEV